MGNSATGEMKICFVAGMCKRRLAILRWNITEKNIIYIYIILYIFFIFFCWGGRGRGVGLNYFLLIIIILKTTFKSLTKLWYCFKKSSFCMGYFVSCGAVQCGAVRATSGAGCQKSASTPHEKEKEICKLLKFFV